MSKDQGLFQKYRIIKRDRTRVDPNAEYFVLRLDDCQSNDDHRRASIIAVRAYARSIRKWNPELSEDLLRKYKL